MPEVNVLDFIPWRLGARECYAGKMYVMKNTTLGAVWSMDHQGIILEGRGRYYCNPSTEDDDGSGRNGNYNICLSLLLQKNT